MTPTTASHLLAFLPIVFMSLILPWLGYSRRGILFGVTVPLDFSETPDARRALRDFRLGVLALCLAMLAVVACITWQPSVVLVSNAARSLAPAIAVLLELAGAFYLWHRQSQRIKPFAVAIPLERQADLLPTSTTLPILFGALSVLPLFATAFWLRLHWNQIPDRWVKHWSVSGAPTDFGTRSIGGVYGTLIAGGITVLLIIGASIFMSNASGPQATQRRRALAPMAVLSWLIVGVDCLLTVRPLFPLTPSRLILASTMYLTFVLAISLWMIQRCGLAPFSRTAEPYDSTPDAKWYGGIIYYNPTDAAILVPKRFGWGWTLNFARPAAWVYLGTVLLFAAAMGFLPELLK